MSQFEKVLAVMVLLFLMLLGYICIRAVDFDLTMQKQGYTKGWVKTF